MEIVVGILVFAVSLFVILTIATFTRLFGSLLYWSAFLPSILGSFCLLFLVIPSEDQFIAQVRDNTVVNTDFGWTIDISRNTDYFAYNLNLDEVIINCNKTSQD